MPTIDLTDDEYAAVTAAIRRAIEDYRFPLAPRLNPLRAALAKFDAEPKLTPEPPLPSRGANGRGESQIDHFGRPSGKALPPDGRGTIKRRAACFLPTLRRI